MLRRLNKLNVELPIEVFHFDDELHDSDQRREIEELGARMISVSHAKNPGRTGFKADVFMLQMSSSLKQPSQWKVSSSILNHRHLKVG